ncbi:hypothetical protein P691DRAFT_76603 [Macrolepiota fuliginosa MF-IS2]|uniref:Smr domain-containing protein n=1 Tax=Macrolepiota fuliginosa MF-IS2 TaxID=1400762 RepID=A0A9P5XAU6_9AGAR|nr:hypothetical protein P691DRAFT_76603 [Macrolepiota fuliginosa MF-IS2]
MDVALSLATGLGLRVCLALVASPADFIASTALGIWEGIFIHQLSFHPRSSEPSSPLDHYLAFGLRLVFDLLISKSWTRVAMVGTWATVGTAISESTFPSLLTSNSPSGDIHKSASRREREREKRRQQSRSAPSHVPSHVRVYQAPESSPPSLSAPEPGPQTSTPAQLTIQVDTDAGLPAGQRIASPSFQPPSPPSFFLHADGEPSPFPDSPSSPKPTVIISQIPVRPDSALAFYQEGEREAPSEPNGPSHSPHLPTPPDSTIRERTMDSRVDRLSTIDEITSRSEHISEDIEQGEVEGEENYILISHGGGTPLPIPNPTSHYIRADDGTPIQSLAPSTAPSSIPLPIPPVPYRPGTPSDDEDPLRTPGQRVYDVGPDSDSDELRTPPGSRTPSRHILHGTGATTPRGGESSTARPGLSPLWDSQSLAQDPAPGTSITSYAILQPPVQPIPLGPLLDSVQGEPETIRPISPSITSNAESILSTRIPPELLERAEDLRKKAIEHGRELDRLRGELNMAQREGRARDALFLREDIRKAEDKIKRLHKRAARRYFAGRNNLQKPGTIDVHGLKPGEALDITEQEFRELLRNGQSTLKVIVGKGLHSKGGIPVVKNYLMTELQRYVICLVQSQVIRVTWS